MVPVRRGCADHLLAGATAEAGCSRQLPPLIPPIMRYISTRGTAPTLDFENVTLTGLASDGGLYVPEAWPHFTAAEIAALRGLSYVDTAVAVMRPFVQGSLDPA